MSIEKFSGKMNKEESGCTIMINETLQGITDIAVLGLYCYLLTKPQGWCINANEIMKHFNITNNKAYKHINQLIAMGLLARNRIREKGKYIRFDYVLYLKARTSTASQPFLENQEVVNQDMENHDTYITKNLKNKEYKNNISDFKKTKSPAPAAKEVEDVVAAYHEELPECPKIKKIGTKTSELFRLIVKMILNWPEYSESKSAFTIESFRGYLRYIKQTNPGFLQPYATKHGNMRRNNLKSLIREDNILRFINEEFNFKKVL